MRTRKLKERLKKQYGQIPDQHYFHGDMEYIRAYFDYRRENQMDDFLIDDISWSDLDMDDLFKRINPGLTTSGEQYLYYMLRSPAVEKTAYDARKELIRFAEEEPELRLKLQTILARLGRTRRADLSLAFAPSAHGVKLLLFYSLLLLLLAASAVMCIVSLSKNALTVLALMLFLNSMVHEFGKRSSQLDYDTVNYSVSMIFAMQRLRRLHNTKLDSHLAPAYTSLDRLQAVIHTGGVSTVTDNGGLGDVLTTITLLDLITYEFLKNKLSRCRNDIFIIHEYLGRLDAAIAIASYRKSVKAYTEPELSFSGETILPIHAERLLHPLLADPIPNDCAVNRPMLITGSNASGKSTYLKTLALAAIMSQSICTCLADSYRASAFRIYSSMALNDDLLAGESYYIVETKSLKRIMDCAKTGGPIFCVIDEVLRGTNTVERIAASSEILKALAESGVFCIAATHDIELCDILSPQYTLCHFEDQVGKNEMLFDYKLREGRATSRNAINLLRLLGFDDKIVSRAHSRANRYLESGSWTEPGK